MARRKGTYVRVAELGPGDAAAYRSSLSTAGTKRRSGQGTTDEAREAQRTEFQVGETQFSPLMAKLMWGGISSAPTMSGALERSRILYAKAYRWVHTYEGRFDTFKNDWLVLRNSLPLQARLVVEQILSKEGPPWRSLVTGFRAID